MTINTFDGIPIFVGVVDAGGFTAAARQLGHSTSHVSKEIARLEERLGVRLLNRTTRSLSLTDPGRVYYQQCRQIMDDAAEAMRSVTDAQPAPRGLLKISAPVSFGLGYLADVLPVFLSDNPDVSLDLEINDRMVDVVSDGFDVVLRIGHLKDTSLIARQITTTQGVTVASPGYWRRHGKPGHPSDLAAHTCISYSLAPAPTRWAYQDHAGRPIHVDVTTRVLCNSAEMERALALAGTGVTRLPEFACRAALAGGLLEPALVEYQRPPMGIFAVYPHRRHLSKKVRAFIDFLVDRFGA